MSGHSTNVKDIGTALEGNTLFDKGFNGLDLGSTILGNYRFVVVSQFLETFGNEERFLLIGTLVKFYGEDDSAFLHLGEVAFDMDGGTHRGFPIHFIIFI